MPVREITPEEAARLVPRTVRELTPEEEARLQPIEGEQELRAPEQLSRGINIGIAEGLGAPVDAVNALLGLVGLESEEPFLGSQQIRRGFSALGIAPPPGEEDPDSLLGSVGRITGMASTFLLPVGPAGRAAAEVSRGVRAAPTTVRGAIVQDIGRAAVEAPGRFLAAETTAAAAAGVGGFVAREKFPDSEAASVIGELVGGITPAGIITTAKIVPTVIGINLARRIARPFTKAGAQRRAERRIQGAARDPERVAAALRAGEPVPEAQLTPAQLIGDEGLLSLERSVIESSEQLKGRADEQIAQATRAIRESLGEIGEGVPVEKTAATLEEARNYIQSLVDTRMRIAALAADEKIAALAPGATREQANLIAREELAAARKAVKAQVDELWAAVPEEVILPTGNSRETLNKFLSGPVAEQEDVPAIAKRVLDKVGEETTVKELQSLRSKLLEEARIARAAGQSNKARIADELAEAVLADLGAQRDEIFGEAGDALRMALDATAGMKQTFDRGSVGRILAVDRRGAPVTPEALTLERAVGPGGPRARVETQALLEAAGTPAARGAVEDFLLDDFQRRAVRDGRINRKSAEAFLRRHGDVLDDFPELRTRIEGAVEADDLARLAVEKAEGLARRLDDPKVSRAAVFLKEPVEGAMERIAKSPKPEKTMQEIVKQARRDATGDALKGIKTGFGDLLLTRASTRHPTIEGDFILSGAALKRMLKDGPVARMAKELLSSEEQKRLTEIADVAAKVEKAVAAKARPEGIIADRPSLLFSTIARIAGAQLGRKVAGATGGGTVQTPGIVSNLFRRAVQAGVRDPARHLLIDAMGDKDLFAALLGKGPISPKFVRKQLNAWLISVGAEEIKEDEE